MSADTTPSLEQPAVAPATARLAPAAGALLRRYGIVVVLLVLVALARALTGPVFLSTANLVNVARQISIEAIIAFGMTLVIITGGIDLSVGSVVALTGVLGGYLVLGVGVPMWAAALLAVGMGLLVGGLLGAFSGAMVTLFAVPPFIATLAMMTVARGVAFLTCDGLPVFNLPDGFKVIGRGYVLDGLLGPVLPVPVLVMLACFATFHVLLTRTTLGRKIYAVGGNEEATRLSGISVTRVKMFVYVTLGAVSGLAGIILTSRLMSGDPKSGNGWELDVIASVVVGGTSLSGGRGTIFGTLVGALIVGVLNNSQNLLGVSAYWQMIVLGLVILGAVLLDNLARRRAR